MPSAGRHGAAHPDRSTTRRRPADPVAPALLILAGLALVLALIGGWVFRAEIAALLAWGSSHEPWWRP